MLNNPSDCMRAVQTMRNEARAEVQAALPALRAAEEALQALNKNDIGEVKTFPKPPALVQLTMEGVLVLLGEKPDWDTARRVRLPLWGYYGNKAGIAMHFLRTCFQHYKQCAAAVDLELRVNTRMSLPSCCGSWPFSGC